MQRALCSIAVRRVRACATAVVAAAGDVLRAAVVTLHLHFVCGQGGGHLAGAQRCAADDRRPHRFPYGARRAGHDIQEGLLRGTLTLS